MTEESKPIVNQVALRAAPEDHARWKEAAERLGKTMSDFIRDSANEAASAILDCRHPVVETYPWSQVCLICGERLR